MSIENVVFPTWYKQTTCSAIYLRFSWLQDQRSTTELTRYTNDGSNAIYVCHAH